MPRHPGGIALSIVQRYFSASLPVRDVIPSRTTPFVTILFIVLNVLAFLYEVSLPESALARLVRIYGLVPAALPWPMGDHFDVPHGR
jgi:hypothetical protein